VQLIYFKVALRIFRQVPPLYRRAQRTMGAAMAGAALVKRE
jgi:hypothetical protein